MRELVWVILEPVHCRIAPIRSLSSALVSTDRLRWYRILGEHRVRLRLNHPYPMFVRNHGVDDQNAIQLVQLEFVGGVSHSVFVVALHLR